MRPARVSSFLLSGALASSATAASAQVVRLVITSRAPMNNGPAAGNPGSFELIRGTVHGEIDPKDPHNTIIHDLDMAPSNALGKVEYVATFALAKPVDMSKAARVLLYQVVNRGNGQAVASPEVRVAHQRLAGRRDPDGKQPDCAATHTCPKITEAFGSSEFWGLRMSPDLIGTDARHDLPLPDNVRPDHVLPTLPMTAVDRSGRWA